MAINTAHARARSMRDAHATRLAHTIAVYKLAETLCGLDLPAKSCIDNGQARDFLDAVYDRSTRPRRWDRY